MSATDKFHPRPQWSRLTPEQQEAAWLHCEYVSRNDGILWLKDQFSLDINVAALSAWLGRRRARRSFRACIDRVRLAREHALLFEKVIGPAIGITAANSLLIAQTVFEELQKESEDRDCAKTSAMMRLALQAYRIHFDAAKEVRANSAALKVIEEGAGNEAEKIKQVMLLLFGERPDVTDFSDDRPDFPEEEALP
jgi:hypothetical protein